MIFPKMTSFPRTIKRQVEEMDLVKLAAKKRAEGFGEQIDAILAKAKEEIERI
jgi:hypothetical protein